VSTYYDIDSPPDAAGGKPGKVLIILLGVAAGLVVLCGGFGFFALIGTYLVGVNAQRSFAEAQVEMLGEGPGARAQARAFLDDLGSGRTEAAFGKTTKDFQQHWDLETLRRMADLTPALQGHTGTSFHEELGAEGRTIFQGFVTGPNGRAEFRLELVREDGNWKIDRIHFP
jgi:hypothetical protein